MVRLLYILILSIFFSVGGYAQVMQTTGGAGGNKFRALKADSFLVVPSGADTTNLANPKWQESTTGAIFVKTTDSTLWFKVGGKWVQAGSGGTGGGGGGTITNISFRAGTVVDTLYFTDSGGDTDFYYVVVKDGLISGGVVTYTGFARTYAISAALFRKNGQFYTTNDTTITIAALSNPDSSRSDVFVVNTSGQATTLTGVESANPLTPQIDPDTEVYLTHVTLSPSAPSAGIDTTVIYDENTEWVGGASGVTVNFAGTITPYRGTKVTDVSAINSGDIIGYGTGTAVNRTSYAGISLFLKLKATMPNNNNILVSFFNGNTQVSSEVTLPITKTNTTSYQGLSLGFDAFSFTNNLFDSVRFRYSGSGITGLYMDFIYLQNGMAPVVINPGTDFVQNIRRVGDNIEQQKNGVWTPVIDISDKKSGTVTSVATGLGLTGGTITTTGTVSLDTASSVVLSRQRAANTYEPIIGAPNTANRYWNGYKQFVSLNTDSIAEGATNLFYTNARARGAISLTTTGTSGAATYNSSTGVLNIPQYSGGGGSPGGSNTQVQYNSSGSFAGSSNMVWDNTNGRLSLGGSASPLTRLSIVAPNANAIGFTYDASNQYRSFIYANFATGQPALSYLRFKISDGSLTNSVDALTIDGNKDLTGIRNITATGTYSGLIASPLKVASGNATAIQMSFDASENYRSTIIPNFSAGAPGSSTIGFNVSDGTTTGNNRVMTLNGNQNVMIATTTENSRLTVNGSFSTAVRAISGSRVLDISDYTILASASGGAYNVGLPTAVGITGRIYVIKKTDSSANAVTITTSSSQTIDGATTYSLATQYKYVTVQSDGANWFVIANN